MKQKKIKLTVDSYRPYCTLLSSIFRLTSREVEVLSELLEFNDREVTYGSRKYARLNLPIDQYSLNNHIKSLKDKGVLIGAPDAQYHFHPLFKIDADQESLTFELYGKKTVRDLDGGTSS